MFWLNSKVRSSVVSDPGEIHEGNKCLCRQIVSYVLEPFPYHQFLTTLNTDTDIINSVNVHSYKVCCALIHDTTPTTTLQFLFLQMYIFYLDNSIVVILELVPNTINLSSIYRNLK